jgi:ATP/maltotriose-dependent transcriptional regulator MalT
MAAGRVVAERFLEHPDPWGRAAITLMIAVLADNEGDFPVTEELIPKALAAFEELGDRWGIGTASSQMAEIRRTHGDLDGAVELLQRARRMMIELLVTDDEAQALVRIAQLRMEKGDLAGARRDLETAQRIAAETGSRMADTFVSTGLAAVSAAEGDLTEARRLLEETLADTEGMQRTIPQFRAMTWGELAGYEAEAGDLEAARDHLRQAVTEGVHSTDMPVLSRVTVRLARYVHLTGDPVLSAQLLGAAACARGHDGLKEPATRQVADQLRATLGAEQFMAAFEKGKALGREAVIALLNRTVEGAAAPVTGPTASSI